MKVDPYGKLKLLREALRRNPIAASTITPTFTATGVGSVTSSQRVGRDTLQTMNQDTPIIPVKELLKGAVQLRGEEIHAAVDKAVRAARKVAPPLWLSGLTAWPTGLALYQAQAQHNANLQQSNMGSNQSALSSIGPLQ